MASIVFGRVLMKHLCPDDALSLILSNENPVRKRFDPQASLAQAAPGIVPQAAADDIAVRASVESVDPDAIAEGIRTTRHPLVPALHALQHERYRAAWTVEWKALPGICMGVGLAPRIVDRLLERPRSSG